MANEYQAKGEEDNVRFNNIYYRLQVVLFKLQLYVQYYKLYFLMSISKPVGTVYSIHSKKNNPKKQHLMQLLKLCYHYKPVIHTN